MKIIYKYSLSLDDEQIVKMPKDAQILTVQIQYNEPHVWALVNPDSEVVNVKFKIIGTGSFIKEPLNAVYVGTYQLFDGRVVFHLFKCDTEPARLAQKH